jgi:hypothetical protein
MQRLTEDQLARLETLATERRGRPAKGAALRGWVAQRAGAPHPRRSGVDRLAVVGQRRPPSWGLPVLHDPTRGAHRHLEASPIHPSSAWKGCSRNFALRGFSEARPGSSSRPIHVPPLDRWRSRCSRVRSR